MTDDQAKRTGQQSALLDNSWIAAAVVKDKQKDKDNVSFYFPSLKS